MEPRIKSNDIIDHRYRIKRFLGEGGMSLVYLAEDLQERADVAVKILKPGVTSSYVEDAIRFRREIEAIGKLRHPNIIQIKAAGQYNTCPYIVMELLQGQSLYDLLKKEKRLELDNCVEIVRQLAETLKYVHGQGILHRDLKPGNVMLAPEGEAFQVKLLDFGLATIMELSGINEEDEIAGTFGYMSPEATGIVKRRIDERSDLYSLGAVFYHLLTGERPFKAREVSALLHQQVAIEPEPPCALRPEMPSVLQEIVLKLLCKDPELRYQSARGLLHDLEEYLSGRREFIIGAQDQKTKLSYHTKLVGREEELREINRLFQEARSGRGSICLLGGEAGVGKTRLVEEMRAYACEQEALFLEGRCFSQENKTPYQPFREAINGYIRSIKKLSDSDREDSIVRIRKALGDSGEVIIRLNPQMEDLLGEVPELVPLDPERENQRFLMVAAKFFHHMVEESRAAILFLDDLQWADEGTLALLEETATGIENANLLIFGTYRDNEIGEDHSLGRMQENLKRKGHSLKNLILRAFDQVRCKRLVAGILGEQEDRAEKLARYILEKSGGNPFFALTLLRELVEQKGIVWNSGCWEEDWERIKSIQVPVNVVDMILLRTRNLPEELDRVLRIASVMGSSFEMELLYEILGGNTEEQVVNLVDEAVEKQLMEWSVTDRGKLLFVHDRVKQAFYEKIGDDDRKAFHSQVAQAIERRHRGKEEEWIFDLARHYAEAGDRDKTLKYALPAAERARADYANQEAARYYRAALKILEERDAIGEEEWVRIKEGLADVCLVRGKSDEVIGICKEILPYKKTPLEQARIYRNIGIAHFKKAEWRLCEEEMAKGLSLLGDNLPGTRKSVLLSLVKEMLCHVFHIVCPIPSVRSERRLSRSREAVEIVHLYMHLNWSYILSDKMKFVRSILRMLNVAEIRIGKSKELAQALAGYAGTLMSIPFFNSSLRVQRKAMALRKELKDEWGLAQSLFFAGYSYLWSGNYQKGIELCRQAGEKFERMGDMWELAVATHALADAFRYLGDYEKSISLYSKRKEISERINDAYGATGARRILSYCYIERGNYEKGEQLGEESLALSKEKEVWFIYCTSHINLGYLEIERKDYDKAIAHLDEARELDEKYGFIKDFTVYLYSHLADAYMGRFSTSFSSLDTVQRRKETAKIRRACRLAVKKARQWPNHYGAALRVTAKYCALTGHKKKAEDYFLQSIEQTKSLGRKYELGRSYYEYGEFLNSTGRNGDARANREAAHQVFKEIGAREYLKRCSDLLGYEEPAQEETGKITPQERLQMDRRMTAVLDTSRYLSSILDLDELLEKIMDKTIELVGAERGILFLFPEETQGTQGVRREAEGEGESQSSIPNQSAIRNPKSEILPEPRVVRNVGDQDPAGFRVNQSILSRVVEERTPLILEDASVQFAIRDKESVSAATSKSVLCAPLMAKGNLLGIIYLDNHLVSGLFNEEDLKILEMISSQSAVSVENARLYKKAIAKERMEQDLNIAGQIQRLFLPKKIEEIKDVSIDAYYSPAEFIGGDYYDLVELDDHRYGIIIVDITGHGSSAAIVMSVISFIFHSIAQRIKDTAEMMRELNNELVERLEMKKFATGIFLIYDTEREVFEYTNAGHSSILLYKKKTDRIVEHDKGGVQLGIMKDLPYEKDEFAFEEGDIVLLETDGVDETRDEKGRLFSTERVKNLLLHYKNRDAHELNQYIISELNKFRGNPVQQDDITMIALKKCSMKTGVLE